MYNLRTFTFKNNGAHYEYKYAWKEYKNLSATFAQAKKWVKTNYPTARITHLEIAHKGEYSKIIIHFRYRNTDPDVHFMSYGKMFERQLIIEYRRK